MVFKAKDYKNVESDVHDPLYAVKSQDIAKKSPVLNNAFPDALVQHTQLLLDRQEAPQEDAE